MGRLVVFLLGKVACHAVGAFMLPGTWTPALRCIHHAIALTNARHTLRLMLARANSVKAIHSSGYNTGCNTRP